jgi:hypothetical protein
MTERTELDPIVVRDAAGRTQRFHETIVVQRGTDRGANENYGTQRCSDDEHDPRTAALVIETNRGTDDVRVSAKPGPNSVEAESGKRREWRILGLSLIWI